MPGSVGKFILDDAVYSPSRRLQYFHLFSTTAALPTTNYIVFNKETNNKN